MSAPLISDYKDPLFKGCTRPAMIWGIPITPLVVSVGTLVLLSVWISFLFLGVLIAVLITLRQITKTDDQQLRLLGLQAWFRIRYWNANHHFWQASTYSPLSFKVRRRGRG